MQFCTAMPLRFFSPLSGSGSVACSVTCVDGPHFSDQLVTFHEKPLVFHHCGGNPVVPSRAVCSEPVYRNVDLQ